MVAALRPLQVDGDLEAATGRRQEQPAEGIEAAIALVRPSAFIGFDTLGEVLVEGLEDAVVQVHVDFVLCGVVQLGTFQLAEQTDGIMREAFPQVIVEAVEETLRVGLPGPPQVVGQLAQAHNAAGKIKMIREFGMKCIHGGQSYHARLAFY